MKPFSVFCNGIRNVECAEAQDLAWVADKIRSHANLRQAITELRLATAEGDHAAAKRIKDSLPCACFSGIFARREDAALVEHSGLVAVDVDGLEDFAAVTELIGRAKTDPCVALAYVSPRGLGARVVVATDCASGAEHPHAVATAWARCRSLWGAEPDTQCADLSRASFLSWDTSCYVNEGAEILSIDRSLPLPSKRERAVDTAIAERVSAPGALIPPGHRHAWILNQTAALRRAGWEIEEIVEVLADRATKVLDPAGGRMSYRDDLRAEIRRAAEGYKMVGDEVAQAHGATVAEAIRERDEPFSVPASALLVEFPAYRQPLIHGLLRVGETLNIIAAPKVGKSWLVLQLALSISNGDPWLSFQTEPSRVLLIDNELHKETATQRLRAVSQTMGVSVDWINVTSLRGRLRDIHALRDDVIAEAKRIGAKVIIIDALYRILPADMSESGNNEMTQVYNLIDLISEQAQVAIICIHHSSKGNQSEKSVTDVGSGAGAISRAADSHMTLREHEMPGHTVVDAVTRSWPSPASFVLWRPDGLLWARADGADVTRLKGRRASTAPADLSEVETAVLAVVGKEPIGLSEIRASIEKEGQRAGRDRVEGVLAGLVRAGRLHRRTAGPGRAVMWSTEQLPEQPSLADRIATYRRENPGASTRDIAAALGCSDRAVRRVVADHEHAGAA